MDETSKNMRGRRKYDEAFKKQAVALVQTSGRSLNQVAAELGVSHWDLRDWRGIYGARSPRANSRSNSSGCRNPSPG